MKHAPDYIEDAKHHEFPVRTYVIIYAWLMLFMVLTIAAAFVDLGGANILIAMLIASIKATLVVLFFMHVKYAGKLVWIFSGAAFIWLGVMLVLTMSDYVSRTWVPRRIADHPAASILRADHAPQFVPRPTIQLRDFPPKPWHFEPPRATTAPTASH